MKTDTEIVHVRFVVPIGLGLKQGIKSMPENDKWTGSIELVDGGLLKVTAKAVNPDKVQLDHMLHTTYVPLTNVEWIRCRSLEVLKPESAAEAVEPETEPEAEAFAEEASGPQPEPEPEPVEPKLLDKLMSRTKRGKRK